MPVDVANEIAAAVRVLSRHRLGAIILVDPVDGIAGGAILDAVVSRDLVVAIFVPEYVNPLHEGSLVVRGDRIERAGVLISWAMVIERAAELARGVAIAVEDNSGEIRIADRTGIDRVSHDEVIDAIRRHVRDGGP